MITNQNTKLNAVIGHPLEHTLTPKLHNAVYKKLDLNTVLLAFTHKNLKALVNVIRELDIQLTAVTMPHKQAVIDHLDDIDKEAKAIGSVNTVINKDGLLIGYNTDIEGIRYALKELELKDEKVLLLGAGGAAQPLAYYVNKQGGQLYCLNRDEEKAKALMKKFGGEMLLRSELAKHEFKLIVNATPLGMYPFEEQSPIKMHELRSMPIPHAVFDFIYNPKETLFLKNAKSLGISVISGLDMFVAQGLEQIRLFSGQTLDPHDLFFNKLL